MEIGESFKQMVLGWLDIYKGKKSFKPRKKSTEMYHRAKWKT